MTQITELEHGVTVDVGMNTGIAYWRGDSFPATHTIKYRGVVKKNLRAYLEFMANQFDTFVKTIFTTRGKRLNFIQIEGVEVWGNSNKSITSATRGDLITVAYLVGAFTYIAEKFAWEVTIKTAPQWKGQLSKEGTVARVKRINGLTYENEHVTDAVAMGFARVEDIWFLRRKVK